MLKSITKNYVLSNRGCYSRDEALALSFMAKDEFTLLDLVNSEMPLKDKFWFVIRKAELTTKQKQELAIAVAEIVLVVYENKYPNDARPREAIQAAKDYLGGAIDIEQLRIKRAAADAAAAAADAAYAAADAAYAAADAADAAYAAAYADAAADAADAAYAAAYADAAALQQSLLNYLIDLVTNG